MSKRSTSKRSPAINVASTSRRSPARNAAFTPKRSPSPATARTSLTKRLPAEYIPVKNKPGEPEFQLKIEPAGLITFKSNIIELEECKVEVKITNITPDRQCFKVKTTSNELFRVRPPFGFLDRNETKTIKFCFKCSYVPDANRHLFVIYHRQSDEIEDPNSVWKKHKISQGMRRMAVQFEKMDGTVWACTQPAKR